jgi:ABC-type transporter Mla subunit MlaD
MSTPLDDAQDRLVRALKGLERAVETRLTKENDWQDLEQQLQMSQEDRADIAEQLDKTLFSLENLESVNKEVAVRLDAAMETIRGVLSSHGGA